MRMTAINVKSSFTNLPIKIPPLSALSKIEHVDQPMCQPACHSAKTAPTVDSEDKGSLYPLSQAGAEKPREAGNSHQDACHHAG